MTFSEPASQSPAPQTNQIRPTFRSGAVARMAGMPVATLRIWEQRYQATRPTTAESGHRLYLAADVERVILLRRLTEQGHAIRLLAALETTQLHEMMHPPEAPPQTTLRAVVVGQALAGRLQRLCDRQPWAPALQTVAAFDTLAEATQAAENAAKPAVDLLVWQAASLQPGAGHELRVAQDAWQARAAAVVYRYSSAEGRAELTGSGVAMLHEPADDDSLGQWLTSFQVTNQPAGKTDPAISPPRFDDAALTEFAELSSAVACECPSHLAQLLLQISNFETYSGECANRSAADAKLHDYLQQVAGAARILFETALEHVAIAEGLPLPLAKITKIGRAS
jgi:DNA-binding transcriptional MerR regulator